jgi:DivIVA domain-containing protein
VFVFLVIVALAVVAGVSLLLVGEQGRMPDETPDREPADLPDGRWVARADLDRVRFALAFRGYRMDQVDAVLDRVASDVDALEQHVVALEEQLKSAGIEPVAVVVPVAQPPQTSHDLEDESLDPTDADADVGNNADDADNAVRSTS